MDRSNPHTLTLGRTRPAANDDATSEASPARPDAAPLEPEYQVMSRRDARKSPMPSEENPPTEERTPPSSVVRKFTRPARRKP